MSAVSAFNSQEAESQLIGRNLNHAAFDASGVKVFRKRLSGVRDDKMRRFINIKKWNMLLLENSLIHSPKLIGYEEDTFVVDFEWINTSQSFQEVLRLGGSDDRQDALTSVMKEIASVHMISSVSPPLSSLTPERGVNCVFGVTPLEYSLASGGELELLALFHADNDILSAAKSLLRLRKEQVSRYVVSHGDFRVDQVLLDARNRVFIIDFEELCLAHPEFDLGSFFASIIFSSMYDVFGVKTEDSIASEELDDLFLRKGSAVLAETLSEVFELVAIYSMTSGITINIDLLILELGWSILERVLSRAKFSFVLSATDKAIAGIARMMMMHPELVKEIIGKESEDND